MTGDKSNQPRNVTEGYNANAGTNLPSMEKGTNAGKNTPSTIQNVKSVPKPPPPKKN